MTDQPLRNRICMVTGATAGLGLATAEALAKQGATVIAVGRSAEKGADVVHGIQQQAGNPAVEFMLADLSSQQEIRRLVQDFTARYPRLHVLVNSAGGSYSRRRESVDGIELTFALNHLGYFLLTNLLLDTLKASAPARIVNVSSEVHRQVTLNFDDLQAQRSFNGYRTYMRSKLANLLFTYELARRLEGTGVTANAAAPGLVKTNLGLQDGGMDAVMKRVMNALMGVQPQVGAQAIIYLASSPQVDGASGKYFSKGKEVRSSDASYDREAGARLWQISAEMTGLAEPNAGKGSVGAVMA
jgi:NAD(P)-dependent dehydrogenase (short-subunit alcohol dehydrogenase family)